MSQLQASPACSTDDSGRRLMLGLIAMVAFLALMALGAGTARAEIHYTGDGLIGDGYLGGYPESNTGIAIEESTGYVLVVQQTVGRVTVLDSDQTTAAPIATFGEGELSSPTGIAIDQTDDSIYISDAGNNRIVRYTSDGATPPTYTLDPTYTSPVQGTGAGEVGDFAAQLAIDPPTGDLLVADTGNKRVERFDSSGAFLDSFDGADAPGGAFTSLLDITVTPDGEIYVVANGTATVEEFSGETTGSVVEHFASDGSFVEKVSFEFAEYARAVAYDPRTQSLLVAQSFGGPISNMTVIRGGNPVQRFFYGGGPYGHVVADLTSPQAGSGVVLSLNAPTYIQGGVAARVLFFDLETAIDPASAVTSTGAHLAGTVDPNGATEVSARFEFRPVGGAAWSSTPDQSVPASASPEPVEDELSGLLPAQKYEVRLRANRLEFSEFSPVISFETQAVAPVATTAGATGISETAATLNGSVTAEGAPTTYFFEYGTTSAYGSQVPAPEAPAGSGRAPHRFRVDLPGLTPGTTYHYRLVAKNSAGIAIGDDVEFTTATTSPTGRTYEQVTPVDQQGGNINGGIGFAALPGGGGISYATAPAGGDVNATPNYPRMLSLRGEDDWNAPIRVDPPFGSAPGIVLALTSAVSEDGTHAVVVSNRALTPGAAEGYKAMNVYLEDLRDGSYTLIGSTEAGLRQAQRLQFDSRHMIVGATPNFDRLVFWSPIALTPGAPDAYTEDLLSPVNGGLYRWSEEDGLEVASLDSQPTVVVRYSNDRVKMRQTSADLNRVFFQTESGIYLWEGDEIVPLSVSELDGTVKPGFLYAASRSGRYVFFASSPLTAESPEGIDLLYRLDLETQELEFISKLGQDLVNRVLAVSDDGSTVYINSYSFGESSVWRDGELATLPPQIGGIGPGEVALSPTGRYVGIAQFGNIYHYDTEAQKLSCASCDAGSPNFNALVPTAGGYERNGTIGVPQWVGDNGGVYFTSPTGLVPADTNGTKDAYEFRDGQLRLVSPGDAAFAATFMDMSEDGRDVYFVTDQPLVARDTNRSADIYDARRGGGLAVQNQVPGPPCAGESCQPPVGGPPAAIVAGSEAVTSGRTEKSAKGKSKRCKGKPRTSGKKRRKCHAPSHGRGKQAGTHGRSGR
ncbi:MAG TPA: hypothetical protein VFN92_09965 [Solirubrobacterales bacterium]|nr:hypothetical protein [Solirubrobacterales bacterium]